MENDIPTTSVFDEEKNKKLIKTLIKNNKYEIKFYASDKTLYVQCLDEASPYPIYEKNYNLNNLINLNKYFQSHKDIKEVCSLIKSINENSIKIDKNKENIVIKIKYTYMEKIVDIDFELSKTKKDYDKIILDLFQRINEIKEEIIIVKNTNENLKKYCEYLKTDNKIAEKQGKDLDNKFSIVKNTNENIINENKLIKTQYEDLKEDSLLIEKQYNDLIKDNQSIKNDFENFIKNKNITILIIFLIIFLFAIYNLTKFSNITKIITNNDIYYNEKFDNNEKYYDKKFIYITNIIAKEEKYHLNTNELIIFINEGIKQSLGKEINSTKLLYNAFLDGDSVKQFHEKCDGHENTLTIIRTDKGKIFGGFTRLSWESEYKDKEDDKGFLFSYDKKEIYYRNKDKETEIITDSNNGPIFGFYDLVIEDYCLHNNNSCDLTNGYSFNLKGRTCPLNDGPNIEVLNYEVYELYFK